MARTASCSRRSLLDCRAVAGTAACQPHPFLSVALPPLWTLGCCRDRHPPSMRVHLCCTRVSCGVARRLLLRLSPVTGGGAIWVSVCHRIVSSAASLSQAPPPERLGSIRDSLSSLCEYSQFTDGFQRADLCTLARYCGNEATPERGDAADAHIPPSSVTAELALASLDALVAEHRKVLKGGGGAGTASTFAADAAGGEDVDVRVLEPLLDVLGGEEDGPAFVKQIRLHPLFAGAKGKKSVREGYVSVCACVRRRTSSVCTSIADGVLLARTAAACADVGCRSTAVPRVMRALLQHAVCNEDLPLLVITLRLLQLIEERGDSLPKNASALSLTSEIRRLESMCVPWRRAVVFVCGVCSYSDCASHDLWCRCCCRASQCG